MFTATGAATGNRPRKSADVPAHPFQSFFTTDAPPHIGQKARPAEIRPVPHTFPPAKRHLKRDTTIQQPRAINPAVWCDHPDHSRFDHMYLDDLWASPCVNAVTKDEGPLPDGVRRIAPPDGPEGPRWADGVFSE